MGASPFKEQEPRNNLSSKRMRRIRKRPVKRRQTNEYIAALQRLSVEIAKFIEFIECHNLNIDTTGATWVAAICIEHLPELFINNPDLMQRLRAIATELSSP